jgi:hypothetical protein
MLFERKGIGRVDKKQAAEYHRHRTPHGGYSNMRGEAMAWIRNST